MAYIITKTPDEKLLPKLAAMSPYNVYLNQVKSAIEPIRFKRLGLDYLPPQMGGIDGQRKVINQVLVLQLIDFEIN